LDIFDPKKVTLFHIGSCTGRLVTTNSTTGIGQLGENTDATPRDVPLHPGVEKWYREHGFKV
jgi:hypothetical protein